MLEFLCLVDDLQPHEGKINDRCDVEDEEQWEDNSIANINLNVPSKLRTLYDFSNIPSVRGECSIGARGSEMSERMCVGSSTCDTVPRSEWGLQR